MEGGGALVTTIKNIGFHKSGKNFLISWMTLILSKRKQLSIW